MTDIGRLERVDLRELWPHEGYNFSKWLEENIDYLSEALGIALSVVQREESAGAFYVDIVAADDDGNTVVIENQLEPTDHNHLGQVITYLTNLDAKQAIWIAREARPEHKKAIDWLNQVTPGDTAFYLVTLKAYRIGDSPPAPYFDVESGPSAEVKAWGRRKEAISDFDTKQKKFYMQLTERNTETSPHDLTIFYGHGIAFEYYAANEWWAVRLYLKSSDKDYNKEIFDYLFKHKTEIEAAFGQEFGWYRNDEYRASRIEHRKSGKGLVADEAEWPGIQDDMLQAMDRFIDVIYPSIKSFLSYA